MGLKVSAQTENLIQVSAITLNCTMAAATALAKLASQPWAEQEACYGLLLRLLGNVANNPCETKFRSIKATTAKIRTAVLDVPGGAEAVLAAGFALDAAAGAYVRCRKLE